MKYAGEIFYATVVSLKSFFDLEKMCRGHARFISPLYPRPPRLSLFSHLSLRSLFARKNAHFPDRPVPHPVDAGLVEEDPRPLLRAGVAAWAVAGPGGDLGEASARFPLVLSFFFFLFLPPPP